MDLYEAIYSRRDIRKFLPDKIDNDVLLRILDAAHHAGSVGFMQPWDFIIINDLDIRKEIKNSFNETNNMASKTYEGEKKELYKSLKLEGILESPLNICVTCDRERAGNVLGRHSIVDTDLFSTCLAVQNLWLAARAEGVGVGWVSIIDNKVVSKLLRLPNNTVPVAYLCMGYPEEFSKHPTLEKVGWRNRLPLSDVISYNHFGNKAGEIV